MNNFDITYRTFIEGIQHTNSKRLIVEFNQLNLDDFYQNDIYIIKSNLKFNNILSDKHIIIEIPEEVNFNQPVLDMLANASFGRRFLKYDILTKLNKNWIYYDTYKRSKNADKYPLYVFQFDFTTGLKMYDLIRFLQPQVVKNTTREQVANQFVEHIKNSLGFVKKTNQAIIMGFHNYPSKQTIAHELTHYFQEIIKVNISKRVSLSNIGIDNLNCSQQQLQYLFDKKEHIPLLLIDVIKDLTKLYYLEFTNLSKQQFISYVFEQIEKYKNNIFQTKFGGLCTYRLDGDQTNLTLLVVSCYLNINYSYIKNKVIQEFN